MLNKICERATGYRDLARVHTGEKKLLDGLKVINPVTLIMLLKFTLRNNGQLE